MKTVELEITFTETTVTTSKITTEVPDDTTEQEILEHCDDGDYWWDRHDDSGDISQYVVEHRQLLNIEVIKDAKREDT
jgi:hypothetical protein